MTTREELQAIMDRPGFGTGRACPIITGEEHNVTLGSLL